MNFLKSLIKKSEYITKISKKVFSVYLYLCLKLNKQLFIIKLF